MIPETKVSKSVDRDMTIIKLLAEGKNYKEIAQEVNLCRQWVSVIVHDTVREFGCKSPAHLIATLYKLKIFET